MSLEHSILNGGHDAATPPVDDSCSTLVNECNISPLEGSSSGKVEPATSVRSRRESLKWMSTLAVSESLQSLSDIRSKAKDVSKRLFSSPGKLKLGLRTKADNEQEASGGSATEDDIDSLDATTPSNESSGPVTPTEELDTDLYSSRGTNSELSLTPSSESSASRWRLRLSASKDSLIQAFARRARRATLDAIENTGEIAESGVEADQPSSLGSLTRNTARTSFSGVAFATATFDATGPVSTKGHQEEASSLHSESFSFGFYVMDKLTSSAYAFLLWANDVASRYYILTSLDIIALGSNMAYWLALFGVWHTYVGGCILLAPSSINAFTFGSCDGNPIINAPHGPARASYWSQNSNRHVTSFMSLMLVPHLIGSLFFGFHPTRTFFCALAMVIGTLTWSRFAWRSFVLDPSVELGTNDQHSVYVYTTALALLRIRKEKRSALLEKFEEVSLGVFE